MREITLYRDYEIYYDRKSYVAGHDWSYHHKDYDGPEDGRCGTGKSIDDCKEQIDERLD